MRKRITAWLLSVCMAVSLLVLPAGAAGSATVTFSDIGDRTTAMAVESLRLMGVLDGYGDGTFRPGTVLTRAQFCKMAVYALNGSDELGRYRTVTVFPDVKPSHWAAAYINMAAKGKSIIAGYADGQFHPDRTVTVGQAVTILLRMLGYKDEDVGGVWPDSYMAEGAVIGLTDGVGTDGNAGLTRGQAARLFLNLLNSPTKEGGSTFAGTIGQTVEGVLVSADNEGGTGRLKLSTGAAYSLTEGRASNGMLNGMRGTLIVDSGSGRALTFVPEITGSSRTVVLAAAKPEELTDTAGNTYAVSGDTQVFQNGAVSAWSEAYAWLSAGTSLTLYLDAAGSVDYVFAGGGSTSTAAVIVYEDRSTAGFDSLTGGAADYAIYKNGVRANAGDMRRYDVATYSPMDNAIRVCDTRIAGYYEDCSPNPEAPSTITVLGSGIGYLPSLTRHVMERAAEKEIVQKFIENIVRSFTMKNLIGQLTILNPDKIMDDVGEVITRLEILEETNYPIDLKKMLYIHMCVMVERLMLEKGLLPEDNATQQIKCRESFVKNLKESFSVIEDKYRVSINDMEIQMIYNLVEDI